MNRKRSITFDDGCAAYSGSASGNSYRTIVLGGWAASSIESGGSRSRSRAIENRPIFAICRTIGSAPADFAVLPASRSVGVETAPLCPGFDFDSEDIEASPADRSVAARIGSISLKLNPDSVDSAIVVVVVAAAAAAAAVVAAASERRTFRSVDPIDFEDCPSDSCCESISCRRRCDSCDDCELYDPPDRSVCPNSFHRNPLPQ